MLLVVVRLCGLKFSPGKPVTTMFQMYGQAVCSRGKVVFGPDNFVFFNTLKYGNSAQELRAHLFTHVIRCKRNPNPSFLYQKGHKKITGDNPAGEIQGCLRNRLVTARTGLPSLYVPHMSQKNALSRGQQHLRFRRHNSNGPIQLCLTSIASTKQETSKGTFESA